MFNDATPAALAGVHSGEGKLVASNVDALLEQELELLDQIDTEGKSLEVLEELRSVQDQIQRAEWHAGRAGALAARRAARKLAAPIAGAI